jgi:glycosyltransferase involved in cell wall biosynthesis
MTVLIVGRADSVHTQRWIAQFDAPGWRIHLFPSIPGVEPHPELKELTIHLGLHAEQKEEKRRIEGFRIPSRSWASRLRRWFGPRQRSRVLARLVKRLKPTVVHSLETQSAGYLTAEAKELYGDGFPPWIHTNWGSDIYLFGRLSEHVERIRSVLSLCDFYSCECVRDVKLAREFGFRGHIFPVFPNTGGFQIQSLASIRKETLPPSKRRRIMLKGYQGWAGRALFGLRALARCAEHLSDYEIIVYGNPKGEDIKIASGLLESDYGLKVTILPLVSHDRIMRYHAGARVSIGLSISDSISTSLLEAMAMGSFPIQSSTSCAEEWIKPGITGLIVPPEDPQEVEAALRIALGDDGLVDRAADINWRTVIERLDMASLARKAVDMYEFAASYSGAVSRGKAG